MRLDCDILSQRSIDSQISWDFATNNFEITRRMLFFFSENSFREVAEKDNSKKARKELEKR